MLFANGSNRRSIVGCAEYCGAGDNRVGASGDGQSRGVVIFSAVNFDCRIEAALLAEATQSPNLGQHLRQEFLSAKPGVHGHHEYDVTEMKDIFNQLYGASGIERHARPFAEFANPGESAMEMRCGGRLRLDQKMICARLGEIIK